MRILHTYKSNMTRILIYDDNKNIRDALAMIIGTSGDMEVAGVYENADDLDENIMFTNPDVILMDIDMPGMNGTEATRVIRDKFPFVNVLIQTVFDDDERVFDSLCAGAHGYILKNTPPVMILQQIREVMMGGSPMSPSIARKVLHKFQVAFKMRNTQEDNLSSREREVLSLLVQGKPYKLIGSELDISYDTVRSHMKKIYEKLHVNSISEAVSKAIKNRLVD
jgi:DNA-binding NarL/FixJ family response regulator